MCVVTDEDWENLLSQTGHLRKREGLGLAVKSCNIKGLFK